MNDITDLEATINFSDILLGLKLSWLLSSIAYPMALITTIVYWSILYDKVTGLNLFTSINTHAIQVTRYTRSCDSRKYSKRILFDVNHS